MFPEASWGFCGGLDESLSQPICNFTIQKKIDRDIFLKGDFSWDCWE